MSDQLGRNFANRTGHPNRIGSEGDLIVKSTLLGSMDKQEDTNNLQSIRLSINNVDLSRGTLTLNIGYKTKYNFGCAEIMLSEFEIDDSSSHSDLGMIVKYYFKKSNVFGNDMSIAWKWITSGGTPHWEIILKRNGDDTTFEFVTLRYILSSPTVTGNYEVGDTTIINCVRGSSFSDGSSPNSSSFVGIKDPTEGKLPLGSIMAWYPLENKSAESLVEESGTSFQPTNDYIKNLTNGEWELCDGNETIVDGRTLQKPDLRGRFIMGYGSKAKGSYMNDTGVDTSGIECSNNDPSDLGPYNQDRLRHETTSSAATENIVMNSKIVNCGKIGNTGGLYLTKLLPKQQGSLYMSVGSGCGDNANDCRSMNAIAFAYGKPTSGSVFYDFRDKWESLPLSTLTINKRNDSDCYSDTSGFKEVSSQNNLFGSNNLQSFLGTKDNLKGKWGPRYNYARVLLGEGASPHDNKPPYIVCAYIIKVK